MISVRTYDTPHIAVYERVVCIHTKASIRRLNRNPSPFCVNCNCAKQSEIYMQHAEPTTSFVDTEEQGSTCNQCPECNEPKPSLRSLLDHLFNHHNYNKTHLELVKELRKRKSTIVKAVGDSRAVYYCEKCEKPFLSRTGLLLHNGKLHGQQRRSDALISCPMHNCGVKLGTYLELATHADVEHRLEMMNKDSFRVYKLQFNSQVELEKWRSDKERETDSRFVMRSSETKFTYGRRVTMFNCASGYSRKKNFQKRHCPAFLRICERHCGVLDVIACFGHLGHSHSRLRCFRVRDLIEQHWAQSIAHVHL
ncbi:hypothetical protein Q1695_013611 [Nippostrongylus brasiliensis]|nr:hypothetical protein Q1695_013611 [Nippostrongylus brasiliensis]